MSDAIPRERGVKSESCRLSVVIPAYNESEVLCEFHRRLGCVLDGIPGDHEIVYVNDGSTDATSAIMERLAASDVRVQNVPLGELRKRQRHWIGHTADDQPIIGTTWSVAVLPPRSIPSPL